MQDPSRVEQRKPTRLVAQMAAVTIWCQGRGFILQLFLFGIGSINSSFGLSVGSEVLSTSSCNFWGFEDGNRSHQGKSSGSHWLSSCHCHWNVCARNPEPVDVIGDVVDCLNNAIRIHILVAAASHSEGILGLCLGRVDVLVAKAELAKFVLCMKLAGWSCKRSGERSWSKELRSKPQRLRGKGNGFRSKDRLRCRNKGKG